MARCTMTLSIDPAFTQALADLADGLRWLYPYDPALAESVLERIRTGAVEPIELLGATVHPSRQFEVLNGALAARALTRSFLDELAPCGGARR